MRMSQLEKFLSQPDVNDKNVNTSKMRIKAMVGQYEVKENFMKIDLIKTKGKAPWIRRKNKFPKFRRNRISWDANLSKRISTTQVLRDLESRQQNKGHKPNYKELKFYQSGELKTSPKNLSEVVSSPNQNSDLPLPPPYLLEQTLVSACEPEYCLPPEKEQPEYVLPPDIDQIVTVKTTQPRPGIPQTPTKHSKQSSDEYESKTSKSHEREKRRNRDRDRKKSSRDRKHRSDKSSTDHDRKSKENGGQVKSKTGTLNSNSGTLGRKNKGGMWEDPQQRLIQEQLDMMRDEEIIELQEKENKTIAEDERLKNLLSEQAFSRQLQKGLVQSGTSEIESYSEEEFSNIPDRPDRDRLLKMVSQDSLNHSKPSTEDEETSVQNTTDKMSRLAMSEAENQKRQQEEQQRALLKLQEDARNRKNLEEEKRIENERRQLDEERRKVERERRELEQRQEEINRWKAEEEKRRFDEEKRRLELEERLAQEHERKRASEQLKREAEERAAEEQIRRTTRRENEIRLDQYEAGDASVDSRDRRRHGSEDDKRTQRRKWIEEQERLREVEDSIQAAMNDEPTEHRHPYAPDTQANNNSNSKSGIKKEADERMEKEREQLEELLSRDKPAQRHPYNSNRPTAARPKSGYVPVPPSHSFTQNKNKRPLSSFNPKSTYSSQSNVEPLPAVPKPSSFTHDSSPSPDLDESIQGPGVIGAQELYNDPRDKMMRERESIRRDNSILRGNKPDPSRLAFRDRHKIFEQQAGPSQMASKPKMSRKLLQLEQEFGGQ